MPEGKDKRYWKSLEELETTAAPAAEDEFAEPIDSSGLVPFGRRDFLKAAGFSLAAVAATGCTRAPVEKAIPLLVAQEELVPGAALHYASTCGGCSAGCGLLVKTRDGRPVKLEGNPQHLLSHGALCAVGQASILGLYDSQRLQHPLLEGRRVRWDEVDGDLAVRLGSIRESGGAVRFLTGTITSPTVQAAIDTFLAGFRDARHVVYEPLSHSAILDAHQRTHGVRLLPRYRFDRAEVIASFDADFLATWLSPVEHTAGYRAGRDLEARPPRMSYHVQLESRMSVTGSKADRRLVLRPAELTAALSYLAQRVAAKAGVEFNGAAEVNDARVLDDLAARLWSARGRSLVVSGSNDLREQMVVNFVNQLLGNYGATLDLERPSDQAREDDAALAALLSELEQGKVAALFVYGVNPAFDLPGAEAALKKAPLLVSFAQRLDETAALAHYVCPESHSLESWSDAEPVSGLVSVTQPVIRPLGQTRALIETLAAWRGQPRPAYDLLREHWAKSIHPRGGSKQDFQKFWDQSVHDGVVEVAPRPPAKLKWNAAAIAPPAAAAPADGFDLVLYPTVAMADGRHAYNPWLHELPDPITKITWDNYACLAPATAQQFGVREGDVVRIDAEGRTLELPVYIQPGQHDRVVAVALGYGSRLSARFANIGPQWLHSKPSVGDGGLVGKNAAIFVQLAGGSLRYDRSGVQIRRSGARQELASTQIHHLLTVPKKLAPLDGERRPIAQETTFAAFLKDPASGVYDHEPAEDLWPADHRYDGQRWGMVVDLSACTGCSACVIACQAENNIAVVGKDEVRRRREMHWMRIDRYYAENDEGGLDVLHQPLMCQQCENAPCETVCPVLATVHSSDGLNEQVYNRCIGTRYCANNCPYKGRRFNWFNYARDDRLQNLVLNPDVAVRSRGVMEKCTFCVQRIRGAQIDAKRRGASMTDGDVQTACQQTCPAQAIYFGDLNDPNSKLAQMMKNPRRYRVLAELNVRPAVGYLTLVRNRQAEDEKSHG